MTAFQKRRSVQPVQPLVPTRLTRKPPVQCVLGSNPNIDLAAAKEFTTQGLVRGIGGKGEWLSANGTARPVISSPYVVSGDRTIVLLVKSTMLSGQGIYFTSSSGAGVSLWIGQNSSAWSIGGVINGPAASANQKDQVVIVTKQGTVWKLWIDGSLAGTGTNSLIDGTGTSWLTFGNSSSYDVTAARGNLYLGVLYDFAFDEGEVAAVTENDYGIFPAKRSGVYQAGSSGAASVPSATGTSTGSGSGGDATGGSSGGAASVPSATGTSTGSGSGGTASAGSGAHYSVVTTADTIGGQSIRIIVPNSSSTVPYNSANPTPVIIYTHGAGEVSGALTSDTLKNGCLLALIDAGYILAESTASYENWGNQAGTDDYVALVKYVRANYNVKGVAIWSQSMGGLAGLNLLNQSKIPFMGWLGTYPVCSLASMSSGGYASEINTAFGITGIGNATYSNKTYGMDPALRTAAAYRDTPMRFYASASDTTVTKAANTDVLAAIVASSRTEATVITCSGNHGDPSHFQPSDYVAFFNRCFAATARTITITLTDGATPIASLSGLKWAFWETTTPGALLAPVAQGTAEVTDASGILVIPVTTRLNSGAVGWLTVTNSDGTVTQNPAHKAFSGPVVVV